MDSKVLADASLAFVRRHRRAFIIVGCVLVAAWAALFLSSRGLLVYSSVRQEWNGIDRYHEVELQCHYFTGITIVEFDVPYSLRKVCPRLIVFR